MGTVGTGFVLNFYFKHHMRCREETALPSDVSSYESEPKLCKWSQTGASFDSGGESLWDNCVTLVVEFH